MTIAEPSIISQIRQRPRRVNGWSGFRAFLLLLITVLIVETPAQAQSDTNGSFTASGDYKAFPEMAADYTHLQLELEMDDSGQLTGQAAYTFQLYRGGVDTLFLDAEGLSVSSVTLGGESLDYSSGESLLTITLPDSLPVETAFILRIDYSSSPGFGQNSDEWEMRWGALLPGTTHHWLPVVDHPRNRFTTDVSLLYPSGYTAAFSGSPSMSGVVSVDQQSMRFVSDWELSAPSLTYAIGIGDRAELTVGRNRIHMMSRSDLLPQERMNELMTLAGRTLETAASRAGSAYPYRDLQIIVLDDSRWEVKNYGAGIVFAYMNEGSLERQIIRGIAAQWAGVRQIEEQWSDAGAVLLLQEWFAGHMSESGVDGLPVDGLPVDGNASDENVTASRSWTDNAERMLAQLNDSLTIEADSIQALLRGDDQIENSEGLYSGFSRSGRQAWLHWLRNGEPGSYPQVTSSVIPGNLLSGTGILNWRTFAELIYDETGQAMLAAPEPELTGDASDGLDISVEAYPYEVTYDLNEAEGSLRLSFQATGNSVEELVPVTVSEYTSGEMTERSLTFTGSTDEVVLNVSPAVSNIDLSVTEEASVNVQLTQKKPFMFWIYQLRNSELPQARIQAAAGLRDYSENPDLQLALLDFLRAEENQMVRGEMLRTLAAVTNGAAGTLQLFQQRYDANAPPEHQMAIIEAYGNYNGNEQVISNLRQIIVATENSELQLAAIAAMARVTDAQRFRVFTEAMIPLPEMTPRVPLLLMVQAAKGEAESAVQVADALLQPGYSFDLRSGGLSLLLAFDQSMQGWENRLPALLADSDPRIRYLAIDGLEYLPAPSRNNLIEQRLQSEEDRRVIQRLEAE